MKKHIYIASLVLVILVAISAQAQSRNDQQLRFHIPFAFNAGNNVLPGGDYRVAIVNPSSDHSVLRITSSDGKSTMIRTVDVEGWAASKAKISFRHYGDHYFLACLLYTSPSPRD